MERIQALISKINQQADQGADTSDMLATVTQLHSELLRQQQAKRAGTSKVAVVMPAAVNGNGDAGQYERYAPRPTINAMPEEEEVEAEEVREVRVPRPVLEVKPVQQAPVRVETVVVVEEKTTVAYAQKTTQSDIVPDPLNEIPTLSHQVKNADIESLNDKLKQAKTELAEIFKDTPVKDLRKAIGINDRFVFINDLFRGDEAMYERSIKTINGFNIFPEADYWISRELKLKLGWDNEHPLVLQFDQLVKRRFS